MAKAKLTWQTIDAKFSDPKVQKLYETHMALRRPAMERLKAARDAEFKKLEASQTAFEVAIKPLLVKAGMIDETQADLVQIGFNFGRLAFAVAEPKKPGKNAVSI